MSQVRTNQGGSVLSFIIVAVVLLCVVVGGIYLVRRSGTQVQTAGNTSEQSPESSPSPVTEQDKTPSPEPAPVTPVPTSPAPSTNNQTQNGTKPTTGQPQATLPQTGPAETFTTALILAIVTGAVVAYGRSKQHLSSL